MLSVTLPIRAESVSNLREHWAVKARRVKSQRMVTALMCRTQGRDFFREWAHMRANEALRLECTLTRVAARKLDDDNLSASFKAVRDQIAEAAGLDDGDARWTWRYAQAHGAPAVVARLVVVQREAQ
jgi:hypothetical protein